MPEQLLLIDSLGHLFYLMLFVGMVLITRKKRIGWIFRILGEVGWVVLGFFLGLSSVYLWGMLFLVIDLLGYYAWGMEDDKDE